MCHYPPGTSKWNKVEHRLFAQITRNWHGLLLTSHQAIVELISATTTSTGLTVTAELDTSDYPTGLRYTSKQVDALPIGKHDFHPDWNYTVRPEPLTETPVPSRKKADDTPVKHQLFLRGHLACQVGAARFPLVVHVEPVELLYGIDAIVVPQNVYLEMSQAFKSSVSAAIRRAGRAAARTARSSLTWYVTNSSPG